jgi:hypothetical protein
MNQFPPAPEFTIKTVTNFFENFRGDIRKSRCTTGINDTGAKLPPVSTTPVANFSTIFANVVDTGVNDTDGKQWEQLSNC